MARTTPTASVPRTGSALVTGDVPRNKLLQGDVLEQLRTLPDKCIHMCVTSPPYWALRDYGIEGQLGLEKTPEEYINKMVEIFHEVKRVLRDDGTLWLNIGDSYFASSTGNTSSKSTLQGGLKNQIESGKRPSKQQTVNCKPKDLVGIPWMLAFALRADGWYLRSDIIWHKPNPMPESVTDRPTKAHEYIFLLTKSKHYFYDAEAIKEPSIDGTSRKDENPLERKRFPTSTVNGVRDRNKVFPMANKRTVWSITTQPFPEAHFATFPEELPFICIKAGTSEHGCCAQCSAPYERVLEKAGTVRFKNGHQNKAKVIIEQQRGLTSLNTSMHTTNSMPVYATTGWQPTCTCETRNSQLANPLVLDPFSGAGTTAVVAKGLGRDYLGIELNPAYITIADNRLRKEFGFFHSH